MNEALRIEKLGREHQVETFTCGRPALDEFLDRHAYQNQRSGSSVTYVGLSGSTVVGYHTIVAGEVSYGGGPERLSKGLPRHPVPLVVLARLAVHRDWQGRGIGAGLLRDAMLRTLQVGDVIGIRALAVHAKDEAAVSFYKRFGFVPSPTDPLHLFVLLKDVERMLPHNDEQA